MRYGRRVTLPIDPWPRASLGERLSVAFVLTLLLLLPFCAAGAVLLLGTALTLHVLRSYDLGAALRGMIERRARRAPPAPPAGPAPPISRARHLRLTA